MDEFLGPRISSTEQPDVKMILCHFGRGELEGLDNLQGGPSIDPATGLREYSKLASVIENPEVQKIFWQVNEEVQAKGHISPHLHEIYQEAEKQALPFKKAPEDNEPPAHQLEEMGRDGDTLLALVPLNLASFLCDLKGEATLNPKTGLLEFFIRKMGKVISKAIDPFTGGRGDEVLRIGGTVAGAILGGPVGAGAGNAFASYATGKGLQDSAISGFKNYALASAIHAAGQSAGLGDATPGTGGFFGAQPNALGSLLGFGGEAAGAASTGANAASAAASGAAPAAGTATSTAAAATPAASTGFWGGAKDIATSPLGLMAGIGALTHFGAKKHHESEKEQVREHNEEIARKKEEMGYNLPWKEAKPHRLKKNPNYTRTNTENPYYKKGGLVKSFTESSEIIGPGNGQDDAIKTTVPANSYIIDASSVAALGAGSSTAGLKVLKQTAKKIKAKFPKPLVRKVETLVKKTGKQTPVYIANEEFKFDPVTVTLVGHGDPKKGSEVFRNMVQNIRKHNRSNGLGLPPQPKNPLDYMKGFSKNQKKSKKNRYAEGDVVDDPDSYRNNTAYNHPELEAASYGDPSGATAASGYKRPLSGSEKVVNVGSDILGAAGKALSFIPGVGDAIGAVSSAGQALGNFISGAKDQRLASVKEREANPQAYDYQHFELGDRDPNKRFRNNYVYANGVGTGGTETLMKNFHQDRYGNWRKNEAGTPYMTKRYTADDYNHAGSNGKVMSMMQEENEGAAKLDTERHRYNDFNDWMLNAKDHPNDKAPSLAPTNQFVKKVKAPTLAPSNQSLQRWLSLPRSQ